MKHIIYPTLIGLLICTMFLLPYTVEPLMSAAYALTITPDSTRINDNDITVFFTVTEGRELLLKSAI